MGRLTKGLKFIRHTLHLFVSGLQRPLPGSSLGPVPGTSPTAYYSYRPLSRQLEKMDFHAKRYSVWLLTRPLAISGEFTSLDTTSDKNILRHWAVLLSPMMRIDVKVTLERNDVRLPAEKINLGTLYELYPHGSNNTAHIKEPFKLSQLRKEWPRFAVEYIGETSKPHEAIKSGGKTNGDHGLMFQWLESSTNDRRTISLKIIVKILPSFS